MRATIYIPDALAKTVNAHLKKNPNISLSALVQEALQAKFVPKNPAALLKVAGLVKQASASARKRSEDAFSRRER